MHFVIHSYMLFALTLLYVSNFLHNTAQRKVHSNRYISHFTFSKPS